MLNRGLFIFLSFDFFICGTTTTAPTAEHGEGGGTVQALFAQRPQHQDQGHAAVSIFDSFLGFISWLKWP